MTEADRIFGRFPDFIKEYIYSRGWDALRDVQIEAARVIFDTDKNLLLSSGTASGKTEAAIFPILTELCEQPQKQSGISVLYIAPLKSLINDQFYRMEELLDMSGIPIFHWHGDVGASHKSKLLKDPSGILQITPESLESMLINRSNDIPRLFGSLRYVIIDEIHAMIGSDRGSQVICQLSRLQNLIGFAPRRIGLSATIGDLKKAGDWLGADSGRATECPQLSAQKLRWRLGMEHFYILDTHRDQREEAERQAQLSGKTDAPAADAGFAFLYDAVKDRKTLVFSNSREETEYVTATLRQIAAGRGDEDIFLIHHGNLSASLREDAERKMKDESVARAVTCATVTMELGIDIGRLERVVQMDAPTTVSSFLQRMGRSGRREAPPEMLMLYREEMPLPNEPLPHLIPWELLRGIAIAELYIGERFIEPPRIRHMPLSLAFHQTLSVLRTCGELEVPQLAVRLLSMPPLSQLSKWDYRELLRHMLEQDYLAKMEDSKGLILGLKGEKLLSSFKFYAVFRDSEDYTVRCESDEIGTITTPPPVGERFALAGRVWEVIDADMPRRLIYVRRVNGKMEISWPGDSGEVHTRILEKMHDILFEDKVYPYLMPNAAQRLDTVRHLAANTGMRDSMLIHLGGSSWVLFPWLGTRAFRCLKRLLKRDASVYGISDIESERCYYITFKADFRSAQDFLARLKDDLLTVGIDKQSLVGPAECPIFDKYDEFIRPDLLRKAYAEDRLNASEVMRRFAGKEVEDD